MIRLQVMSDLHLEHHGDGGEEFVKSIEPAADVLVLAGDIVSLRFFSQVKKRLASLCKKFKKVIYVPGNHEFYGSFPQEALNVLTSLGTEIPKLRVLKTGDVEDVDGKRVIGATMWFRDNYLNNQYRDMLADFDYIKDFVPWVYDQNKAWLEFAEKEMKEGDIVVTHHAPSYISVPPRFAGRQLNRFFVCDMEPLILERRPALWIHGHNHDPSHYKIGECRIECNPLGYPHELSSIAKFQDKLVVEV